MNNHDRGIRTNSWLALMLLTPLLAAYATQARADQCADPSDVDVKITVRDSCGISVAPVDDADKCGFVSACVKIRKDKYLRWKALDSDDNPVNFQLVFSPFEKEPKASKGGCAREKIKNDAPVAEYKYTVVIADGACAGTIKDPRIKVED